MATMQQVSRTLDTLFSTTWYDVRRSITDQVFKITPLYDKLVEGGQVKEKAPDGTHFEIPIQYDQMNQNTKWFGRGTQMGTADKEIVTNLIYQIRNLGTSIVRYWDDDRKNRGKAKLIDYIMTKLNNTKTSLIDTLENDMWAQNADPLALNALPTLISTTPTSGTVGGLDRSLNSWMSNQTKVFSGTLSANLIPGMTNIFNSCSKFKAGKRKSPDIIFTTQEIYEAYEGIMNALGLIMLPASGTSAAQRGNLGFGNLSFKGVEIYWAPNCPTGCMYFLNTEHLMLPYDPETWMEMTEWKPVVGTSLDKTAQIVSRLQLVVDNFQKHGVYSGIPSA